MVKIQTEVGFGIEIKFQLPVFGLLDLVWEPSQVRTYAVCNEEFETLKGGFSSWQEAENWCKENGIKVEI